MEHQIATQTRTLKLKQTCRKIRSRLNGQCPHAGRMKCGAHPVNPWMHPRVLSCSLSSATTSAASASTQTRGLSTRLRQYSPKTGTGGRLRAHELAHTMQQARTDSMSVSNPPTQMNVKPKLSQKT